MEQMSRLLSEPAPTSIAARNCRQADQRDQGDQTRKPQRTPNANPKNTPAKRSCATTSSIASESSQENPQSSVQFADALEKRLPVQQACAEAVDLNMLD
jgi:hypothetical protein